MTRPLRDDETNDLLRKTRHIAAQTNQTRRHAFTTIAAHEHPEKPVCVAYAPANNGTAVHAYNDDAPGQHAHRPAYNTTTITYQALNNAKDTINVATNTTIPVAMITNSLLKNIDATHESTTPPQTTYDARSHHDSLRTSNRAGSSPPH